jgi:ABC-2 type transport system permease protein
MSQVQTSDATVSVDRKISLLRRFVWSLRRELWEHRSVYLAPMAVTLLILVGAVVTGWYAADVLKNTSGKSHAAVHAAIQLPYGITALLLLITMIVVGVHYCTEALHAERRDRSILFWKSLPVSDAVTVASKVAVVLIALPFVTWCAVFVVHCALLASSAAVVSAKGQDIGALWLHQPLGHYAVAVGVVGLGASFWFLPVYAWLIFVSSWVKRGVLLWAIVPVLGIIAIERIVSKSTVFADIIFARLFRPQHSNTTKALADQAANQTSLTLVDKPRYSVNFDGSWLSSPDLWVGIAIAIVFLIAAIRMRRLRDPI